MCGGGELVCPRDQSSALMPTRLPVLQGEAEWGFAHFQAVGLGERLICEPRVALSGRKEVMAVGIKLLTCS